MCLAHFGKFLVKKRGKLRKNSYEATRGHTIDMVHQEEEKTLHLSQLSLLFPNFPQRQEKLFKTNNLDKNMKKKSKNMPPITYNLLQAHNFCSDNCFVYDTVF